MSWCGGQSLSATKTNWGIVEFNGKKASARRLGGAGAGAGAGAGPASNQMLLLVVGISGQGQGSPGQPASRGFRFGARDISAPPQADAGHR
jgi:hypothetical protein